MQCEDEWSEMHQRFKKEGLDADSLKLEDRLLQVWRWLVDAESNLRNSRRMLDKLYEQQHEEIEEMENYVGKMKKLAEKRATDVEAECSVLKLEKTELLELLDGFGALGDSIYEKVLFLGEEKVKAAEDLEILKNMKLPSNGVNSDILTEMIKVSSEKESLKREVTEMRERIHLLEKSSRQLEIDNDRLSFKGDCFIPSRFGCSSSFTLSRVFVMVLLMVFNVQSLSSSPLVIDLNAPCKKIDRFWTHTGFSPLDSSYGATQSLLLSKDEKINLALISALPNRSISHVRIHWLLNLVYKKNLKYDWSKLDEILDWIVTLKLNMIFEIMGLPQSDSSPHSLNWSEFCSELANHIVARYGQEVVKNWIFELWNEPDLKQYNIANFTTESYLHYAKSCIDGIRSQLPNALIGGPAGLFKNTTNHKLCWGFLEECNSLRNRCNIDFISFHKKAFPEDLLAESLKLALSIQREFPTLWKLPFFNSEADLMSGWWKPRGWRGDVYYAASIVQVVHLFILNNLQNLFMGISNDNGFLNMSPFFFDQRTLLTRFNMSFSNCTQFFKKPVYVATALLGKLENNVVSIGSDSNSSLSGIPSINSCKNASSSTVILTTLGQGNPITKSIEIVFPSSWGPVMYTFHVLSNSLDHPKKIWERYGSRQFPNRRIRELIRKSEEPHLIARSESSKVIKLGFPSASPSVGLIQICTRQVDKPQTVSDLNALNISYNEVLLFWRDDSRCVSTYEVEFCPQESNDINCFRRINKANIILCSFHHADYSGPNEENIRGTYRVRAVNIWGTAGPYSSNYRYPDIERDTRIK